MGEDSGRPGRRSTGGRRGKKGKGRAYAMAPPQVSTEPLERSVIRGTISVYTSNAQVLIDTGASHSFISYAFCKTLGLRLDRLYEPLEVSTLVNGVAVLTDICRGCDLEIAGHKLSFDFILLRMTDFDIIIGIDWLMEFRAYIDCYQRKGDFSNARRE